MDTSYEAFRRLVREEMKGRLSRFDISEQELDAYLEKEEEQIKGAYKGYLNPEENDTREDRVRFEVGASTVSMCLEYCY